MMTAMGVRSFRTTRRGELPLGLEGVVQPLHHAVERAPANCASSSLPPSGMRAFSGRRRR